MAISTLVTPSDWFHYFASSGDAGMTRICDLVSVAGISRVYLRTHDGGRANYPSRVGTTMVGDKVVIEVTDRYSYPESYYRYLKSLDFSKFDPIPTFLAAARANGMEGGLWYTILEDDHGGPFKSDFLLRHPEWRCTDRADMPNEGALDFFFDEVRQYKFAVLDELLEKNPGRIQLDLVRRNGLPSADVNGLFQYGFNPPVLDAFQKETGLDARRLAPGSADWNTWLNFNAKPITDFFIEACKRIRARGARVDLMVWPVQLKTWLAIDLERILDTGLVDSVHIASNGYSYSPADLHKQLAALRPQVGNRPVDIVPSICGYDGLLNHGLDTYFEAMEKAGVNNVVLHESHMLPMTRTGERFRALAFGEPHYKRALHSEPVSKPDWSRVRTLSGFLRGYNASDLKAEQLTEIQVAHTVDRLHVRVTCHERNVKGLLPVRQWSQDNYNVKALGARTWWSPLDSVHLFLCPPSQLNDYFHFVLDPSGAAKQQRLLNENWVGEWSRDVRILDDRWVATFQIPFSSLLFEPTKGSRIGIQAVRAQSSPVQITMLYLGNAEAVKPDEFGFLYFD